MKRIITTLFAVFSCVLLLPGLRADEGMWLFENPPKQQVKEKYHFDLTDEFLDHLRLSSCRFGRGGSASFVSAQGLIATNHHVGARNLHEHSTPENNLLEKGFYAKTLDDELKCPGLEVIVLMKIENITKETAAAAVGKERDKFIAELEQKRTAETGLRCEVMKLYQGGEYHLYCYKVYNDIRLVFAPEASIASFGGDPDNYEYPRYCLDVSLFRAYEDGKPAKIEHFLKWKKPDNEAGKTALTDGDLVFVSGHPGTTNRAYTKEHLEFMRDVYFPWRLQKLFRQEVVYSAFGNRSLENQQRIANALGSVQNYRKRAMGQLQGLQTPALWKEPETKSQETGARKQETRRRGIFRAAVANSPSPSPAKKIADAVEKAKPIYRLYDLFEGGAAFNSQTFQIAQSLVRLAAESQKPNAERLKEFQDGKLNSFKASLFADTPIFEDVEILKLTDSLTFLYEYNGGVLWDTAVHQGMIDKNKSPKELANDLIRNSKVRDVSVRKELAEKGIAESKDPMILFAKAVDEAARDIRKQYEETMDGPTTEAYAELAEENFKKFGDKIYPDATFTLRLSYGIVKGYKEDDGNEVAPVTNIAGMFDRAEKQKHKEPFDPPKSWKENKNKLNPNTAFNFVSTNDIIGGNSGSPIINSKGEIIGLVFDGNIQSLSNNFIYTETQSRCVSVHADVITESLQKIYKADRLVKELGL